MEMSVCQSCGMPMTEAGQFGTNADGGKCVEYCCYCFKEGHFTKECTMDEMIRHCAQFVDEFNKDAVLTFTKEEAVAEMRKSFPLLKRWRNS